MEYNNASDEELAGAAVEGDIEAFEELVRRYHGRLTAYFSRVAGSKEQAEDLAQEVLVKVWDKLKQFNPKRHFRSWLTEIAKNHWIDQIRKRKRIPRMTSIENVEQMELAIEFQQSINDEESQSNQAAMKRCLAGLTEKEQEIVNCLLDGRTGPEIAKILDVPYDDSFRSRMHRLRKKLLKCLKQQLSPN